MGVVRINPVNFLTIGLMAFIAIYAINKVLAYAGKPQWQA